MPLVLVLTLMFPPVGAAVIDVDANDTLRRLRTTDAIVLPSFTRADAAHRHLRRWSRLSNDPTHLSTSSERTRCRRNGRLPGARPGGAQGRYLRVLLLMGTPTRPDDRRSGARSSARA